MQDKTTRLEATSAGTGLKINRKKTELMKINTTANTPVTVGGEPIREFCSTDAKHGGQTKTMQQKIQTFLNTCLRRIFNIRWPEKIRNEELWEASGDRNQRPSRSCGGSGLDWTHPQEASIQHHTPSPDMEPAGEKEERPASQQLEGGTLRQSYVSRVPTGLEWQD
nr:hypothetical protein BaRGS_029074 [Batillaria attramentaria]